MRAVVGTAATEYVFSAAGQRVSEWNGATGAQIKGKYYWGRKPVAYYAGGSTHFEHQDWLGTERMRTAYNGGVEGSYISLPFGDGQAASGADTDANHYGQLDHDTETATDHAQFRQYSSAQGRWLAPDPYSGSYSLRNPQSFNRYVYAGNNPLAAVDPNGMCYESSASESLTSCNSLELMGLGGGGGGVDDAPPPTIYINAWYCASCITPFQYQSMQDLKQQYTYNINGYGSLGGGSGYGGPASNAPNNGTPWYQNTCITSALLKGAGSTALDAIGLLPEGGAVSALFSGFHGAAAVSNGTNILGRVQMGAGLISTASAGSNGSGVSTGLGVLGIAASLGKAAPVPWWSVLCWMAGCALIVWPFYHSGRLDLARPVLYSLGMLGVATAIKWKLRRHVWFWGTMTILAFLHVLLILFVPWTTKWIPAIVVIPIGITDLYAMLWVISVVGNFVDGPKTAER